MPFRIIAADHTGITVSNLERSLLGFWRDVLGFELSHRAHQKGEIAEQITGVRGARFRSRFSKRRDTKSNCLNTALRLIANNRSIFVLVMSDPRTSPSLSIISTRCWKGSLSRVGKRQANRKR